MTDRPAPAGREPKLHRGRFAPTPSGRLHAGSLVAALGSYCDSRQSGGEWWVRVDDLDTARISPGAIDSFLPDLERHGLIPDACIFQSDRIGRYRDAMHRLQAAGRLFPCRCSRRMLPAGEPYPGTCRGNRLAPDELDTLLGSDTPSSEAFSGRPDVSIRLQIERSDTTLDIVDRLHGSSHKAVDEIGDIILWRRDGIPSYALASAIDDAELVSDVVRGEDLLPSTSLQILVMHALKLTPPRYAHLPLAKDAEGRKLGKQTRAPSIARSDAIDNLERAWQVLGQARLAWSEHRGSPMEYVRKACTRWDIGRIAVPCQD